ncbi:MAG: radical SAM protein, partial [Eubacterium sp.]|nr:radical SAM protein [Eubacterium sp.]
MKNNGLYIHIPFCIKKCNYCDFCSIGINDLTNRQELLDKLVDALLVELEGRKEELSGVRSIFIGGGTPSVVPVDVMEKLLARVCELTYLSDEVEFTIECNPGTVDEEKLNLYKRYGVNRLSFGLQSTIDSELKALGRIHTYE